jgi:hypothetical protein
VLLLLWLLAVVPERAVSVLNTRNKRQSGRLTVLDAGVSVSCPSRALASFLFRSMIFKTFSDILSIAPVSRENQL